MSEVLQGVIIGALIASITPLLALFYQSKIWRKEKRIEFLKNKHEKLKALYGDSNEKLWNGIEKGLEKESFSSELWADIEITMPEKVSKGFLQVIREKDFKKRKGLYYEIQLEMKKSLEEIDLKIENEIGKKSYKFFKNIFNYKIFKLKLKSRKKDKKHKSKK